MSKIIFNKEIIELLNQNPYVVKVSEKSITYSDEFKRLFIDKYLNGKTPKLIFEEAGFDVNLIGVRRYEQASARWLRSYNKDGIIGLRDTRKDNNGRPTAKEFSKDEIILKQESKIKLLDEQLELLKKLDVRDVIEAIDNYIEYYNNYRYQWNLKKMTPKQYRNHLLLAS